MNIKHLWEFSLLSAKHANNGKALFFQMLIIFMMTQVHNQYLNVHKNIFGKNVYDIMNFYVVTNAIHLIVISSQIQFPFLCI